MPRLYLVRHGEAAAGYGDALDPGLSDTGREQAEAVAERLANLQPMALLTSPLARAKETAAPLERRWSTTAIVEPKLGEVPSPQADPTERAAWLKEVMQQRYDEVAADLRTWRNRLIGRLMACDEDTVVFSHFVAINAAVGAATNDDRLLCFHPDNGSVTVLETWSAGLTLVERGGEAETKVL